MTVDTAMEYDVVVIGAGAAGLFCAGVAGQRGLKVLLLDHSERVAEKIRISGGGRCNFTNREVTPANFIGENPHFCRSALSRYTPTDFLQLLQRHGIAFHEKHKGQLFCDHLAEDIIQMLLRECDAGGVTRWQPCRVQGMRVAPVQGGSGYAIDSDRGEVLTRNVVVATGGLSIPKIGASDFGYRVAQQFGLRLVPTAPALVPLTFDGAAWEPYAQLAGVSLPVLIETGAKKTGMTFSEDLLFTHRGLSGPAVLQISSYWREQQALRLDLAPQSDLAAFLAQAKSRGSGHGQGAGCLGGCAIALGTDAHWHRRLQEGRGHARRRRYARALVANDGVAPERSVFHRRGGGRDRLARWLQLPVGLV